MASVYRSFLPMKRQLIMPTRKSQMKYVERMRGDTKLLLMGFRFDCSDMYRFFYVFLHFVLHSNERANIYRNLWLSDEFR